MSESSFRHALAQTAEQAGIEVDPEIVEGHVVEQPTSMELVLPTGELINLDDPASCAVALAKIKEMESFIREVKGEVVDRLAHEAKTRGENVFELEDGTKVAVKRNYDVHWDTQALEEALREAGMPEERISEIIVEEVSHSVKAVEANKAAKANPEYAKAIVAARTEVEKRPTISLPRG